VWGDVGRCGEMWGDVGRCKEISTSMPANSEADARRTRIVGMSFSS
jgi:hypothetical protein